MEENDIIKEGKLIIGGDSNIRTGRLGSFVGLYEVGEHLTRRSKDYIIINENRKLIELLEKKDGSC